jgi:hypothetical protein
LRSTVETEKREIKEEDKGHGVLYQRMERTLVKFLYNGDPDLIA